MWSFFPVFFFKNKKKTILDWTGDGDDCNTLCKINLKIHCAHQKKKSYEEWVDYLYPVKKDLLVTYYVKMFRWYPKTSQDSNTKTHLRVWKNKLWVLNIQQLIEDELSQLSEETSLQIRSSIWLEFPRKKAISKNTFLYISLSLKFSPCFTGKNPQTIFRVCSNY